MSVCVLVQTCDRYKTYWPGFWHFMGKHWDFGIEAPIYFCNEEDESETPGWCRRILTGRGTFVQNLTRALEAIEEDEVFLMLEDFWPVAPMGRGLFDALYGEFRSTRLDALQVSNYTPYYKVRLSDRSIRGSELLAFEPDSEWLFNFQARFWRKEKLLDCLVEPEISEREVGSAITAEMAADRVAREVGLKAALFHYLWYPLSGVSYRGQMTGFGKELQNILELDGHVQQMINGLRASNSHR